MSTLRAKHEIDRVLADSVSFTKDQMHVHLVDGREITVPISRFPRLQKADPEQREKWELIGRGGGIHWEEIDEDISVALLLEPPETLLTYK